MRPEVRRIDGVMVMHGMKEIGAAEEARQAELAADWSSGPIWIGIGS